MPKKKNGQLSLDEVPPQDRIVPAALPDVLRDSMMPYAEHVILERALPRVEDGLKPVQRRILFTMQELGVTPDKPHRKSVRIVGDCLGKYHPHGDSSVYDAMVRMAQPYAMRLTLVDGHGNFGSIDNDSAAAMRYTEARLTPLALEMLRDIDKDVIPTRLNFDDSLKEPEVLPSRYPNLLVNGSSGIAVGLATNIPPHNLSEVVDAVVLRISKPRSTLADIMSIVKAPDFPTGGELIDTPEIKAAYETGKGKLTLRAKTHIETQNGKPLIVIDEMPYQVAKSALLERVLKACEEKPALGGSVSDIRDESDREGLRAVIELKRDSNPEKILALLYKYTDMQITFGVNMFVIADGKPKLMGLLQLIDAYILHQKNVVTRRTEYDLERARARAHIVEGLIHALDILDDIIKLIRASKDGRQAKSGLVERFGFTEVQAQAILDLRLQRLTGLEILQLTQERDELLKTIAKYEALLASEPKLMKQIQTELLDISKRFSDARRTKIIGAEVSVPIDEDEAPPAEDTRVVFTYGGMVKRFQPSKPIKFDNAKPDDYPMITIDTHTNDTIIAFTNKGNAARIAVSSIPEKTRERGATLSSIVAGMEEGETCVAAYSLSSNADLLFITERGMIKRTQASECNVRKTKYLAMKLKVDDALISVLAFEPDKHLLMVSRQGNAILIDPAAIEATGRTAGGVIGMRLALGDAVMNALTFEPGLGEILIATDKMYMKRALAADFEPQARGGKGVMAISFGRNGADGKACVCALYVASAYDICLIGSSGKVACLSTEEIPLGRRDARGKICVNEPFDIRDVVPTP